MELINNNCFDALKNIKDNKVDMFLLDLPYGQTEFEWDTEIDLKKNVGRNKKNNKTKWNCCYVLHNKIWRIFNKF